MRHGAFRRRYFTSRRQIQSSLDTFLRFSMSRGPVPVEDVVLIAGRIADALEEAHEKGIVRHDLKPANVELTPNR